MRIHCLIAVTLLGFAPFALAAAEKDTRAGTCDDAKSQVEYFCSGKGNPDDIMVQVPIACNNAKKNMAAACEGQVVPDAKYEFKDTKN